MRHFFTDLINHEEERARQYHADYQNASDADTDAAH